MFTDWMHNLPYKLKKEYDATAVNRYNVHLHAELHFPTRWWIILKFENKSDFVSRDKTYTEPRE